MARTSTKVVATLPKTENGGSTLCRTTSGEEYIVSYNTEKMKATLWKKNSEGLEKISTANSPLDLYDIIPWESQ